MNISKTASATNQYQAEQLKSEKRTQVATETAKKTEQQVQQTRTTEQKPEAKRPAPPSSKVGVNLDQQA